MNRARLPPSLLSLAFRRQAIGQSFEQIGQADAGKHLVSGLNPVGSEADDSAWIQLIASEARVEVFHDQSTHIQQQIGPFDHLFQSFR